MTPRALATFGGALGSVLLAALVMHLLWPYFGHNLPSLFLAAVTVTALWGGIGAGLLATGTSLITMEYLFEPPFREISLGGEELLRATVFLATAVVVGAAGSRHHRAEVALRLANQRLEERVAERTRALARRTRELEALIEASPLAVVTTAADGTVGLWNPAAAHIFGWSAGEVLGRPLPLVPPERAADLRTWIADAAAGMGVATHEIEGQRKDGTRATITLAVAPIPDETGQTPGVMAIVRDITEQRQMEAQLRQSQKLEAIGSLAGGVAHDFNNLLTVILGRCENIMRQLPADHEMRRELEQIERAGSRAAALTRQLLAFSRKQLLAPKVLDLNELVAAGVKLLQRLIGEHVRVVLHPGAARPWVKADPTQIEQVIMNLAVNARDAMPNGGTLTIETADVDIDEEMARARVGMSRGPHVMLAIADTGVGMDQATQARIFEPFFTTKEVGRGTGLGLATVYGVVKQSGGSIWVDSEPNRGTTFRIYLPQMDEARPRDEAPRSAPVKGAETVLVVEDDEAVRDLAREILAGLGYTVLVATHPQEALDEARRYPRPIHLVLTDVVMPMMTGPRLVEELRRSRRNVRALYMSGYTDITGSVGELLGDGEPLVQKPFTAHTMGRAVRSVLDAGPGPAEGSRAVAGGD